MPETEDSPDQLLAAALERLRHVAAVEAGILAVAAALRDILTQPHAALTDHDEPPALDEIEESEGE